MPSTPSSRRAASSWRSCAIFTSTRSKSTPTWGRKHDLQSTWRAASIDRRRARHAPVRQARDAAAVDGQRLRTVDRGAAAQRAMADSVGAAPRQQPRRSDSPSRRVQLALCDTRPRAPSRHPRTDSGCSSTTPSPARSTSTTSSVVRSNVASSATGSISATPAIATSPKVLRSICKFAFEELQLHRLEICIVPRNTNSRRVMEVLGIREEGIALALPRDQRRVGRPHSLRDHRRGMAGTPSRPHRGLGLVGDYSLAMRKACAFALRTLVRRFHIFIFQWRLPSLPLPALAFSAS